MALVSCNESTFVSFILKCIIHDMAIKELIETFSWTLLSGKQGLLLVGVSSFSTVTLVYIRRKENHTIRILWTLEELCSTQSHVVADRDLLHN